MVSLSERSLPVRNSHYLAEEDVWRLVVVPLSERSPLVRNSHYLAEEDVWRLVVVPLSERSPPVRNSRLPRAFRHPNTRLNRSRNLRRKNVVINLP